MKKSQVEQFLEKASVSVANGTFIRLILSRPAKPELAEKILVRLIELQGAWQLSFTFRENTRDVTKNLPPEEGLAFLREQLNQFQNALLGTTTRDWQLYISPQRTARLVAHKPAEQTIPQRTHDAPAPGLLDSSAKDWLQPLGITDASGKVLAAMRDKHRQIGRYVEILSHLAKDCGWTPGNPALPKCELVLADMGCGKGYLTFAAWHLFQRTWKLPFRLVGVETRPELVKLTNELAQKVQAARLEFIPGDIASVNLPKLDALIALHACNTATDEAILRGIESGAKLIVVAPCCHKELRPQLGQPEPFAPVLRHGIMEERMAEWLTDGLRALFLEWAGYRTKVFEFISSEHTPKNLMIAAMRESEPFAAEAAKRRIEELKQFFGIQQHALDPLLSRTALHI